jgi:hypothetical protein
LRNDPKGQKNHLRHDNHPLSHTGQMSKPPLDQAQFLEVPHYIAPTTTISNRPATFLDSNITYSCAVASGVVPVPLPVGGLLLLTGFGVAAGLRPLFF